MMNPAPGKPLEVDLCLLGSSVFGVPREIQASIPAGDLRYSNQIKLGEGVPQKIRVQFPNTSLVVEPISQSGYFGVNGLPASRMWLWRGLFSRGGSGGARVDR
jgi:hypothetical protein